MIVFGTPYSHENDPERAIRASLEMMESIERNGEIEVDNKKIKLKARIGINTGLCISGEIGSSIRKEFTIIGDTVNLAFRLQTNVTPGDILIGEKTYQRVRDSFIFSPPYELKIKGKKDLVTAYTLKGIKKMTTYQEQTERNLPKDESVKLIKSLIKDEEIFMAIKENIALASAGNPLFIEEITQGIKSKKLADVSHFQIPDTVQSIVSARIDLLPIGSKEVLYQAAVMGRDFELSLFQKVTKIENSLLLNIMQELKNYEFILEKEIYPRQHFSFKHSLIQEVAYNSLLYKTRKNLHSQIGLTIEKTFSINLETKVEELAYHFKNSNNKEKAIFYLNKAGDKAQSLYAFKNAKNYYRDCIKILETTKFEKERLARLSEIYNKLAFSQSIVGERKEAEINLNKALEYCKKIRDKDNESLALMNLGNLNGKIGQWNKAIKYFQESLLITKGINNLQREARILKSIGLAYLFKGYTSTGYSYLKESLKICKEIELPH